jgi:2-polyprenyl-3-methyl-5-hydroxy-6-metoxy-1,4-benzoquinol methylase/tetratricopeptide (TPR) repeat protein
VSTAPQTAEDLIQQARSQLQQQQLEPAKASLEASLKLQKTAAAYRGLGNIQFMLRNHRDSIPFFEKALEQDGGDHASLAMLAEAYFELGNTEKAVGYSTLAITAAPQEIRYKERFIHLSRDAVFFQYNHVIENTLLECLKTPSLDCSGAQGLWYNTFTLNPDFRRLYAVKRSAEKQSGFFGKIKERMAAALPAKDDAGASFDPTLLDKAVDFSPLMKPFFLLGLEKITVYTMAFEEFLTALRKSLLLQPERFSAQERLSIGASLAQYCFNTDYILNVTAEEIGKISALGTTATDIALRACYAPLQQISGIDEIAKKFTQNAELSGVLETQLTEVRLRENAAKNIPAITPIADAISVKVREQYEESPYPRWKTIPRNLSLERVADPLRKPGAKVLIAGCGTGQEAAQIATVLPDAQILAVDLSLASLSYAQTRTEKLGFKNITFRQADILQLGSLTERFDGIISGGVLHHLQDPLKGWEVLTGLLNDGGLMRIALYSKIARKHLVVAQDIIQQKGFPPTIEGMRDFRQQSASLLDRDVLNTISAVSDYYHAAMYRDMLFHVQEHCFDIPGIDAALKKLGLTFVQFILPPPVLAQYVAAYPSDPTAASLPNWHKFEQSHPLLFLGMYQFWCKAA